MTGIELIAEKARTNREHKGYTAAHDDEHVLGELSQAGAAYAKVASAQCRGAEAVEFDADMMVSEGEWPFEPESWKPSDDPMRNLVHAGALIVAEIERLQRQRAKP